MSTTGSAESYIELRGSLSIPDAIHGKSAYEIAVANGFDGTEEEWLLHLERAQSEAVEEAAEQALTDIANDRQTALSDIESNRQTALSDIEQAHTEVTTDAAQALSDIAEAKATMLEEIELAAEIVQTTGDSETAVMSQKATTEAIERNSIKNIVTTKNLLTNAQYVEGYKINADGSASASAGFSHYVLTLPAGTYTAYKYSNCVNLTTVETLTDGLSQKSTFTLTAESKIGVNSYNSETKKLFSSEYTADEVEALGEYRLGENVLTPEIDGRFDSADEQISENAAKISIGSIQNIVTSKNLLQFAQYVEGYSIHPNGELVAHADFAHYILTLPAGTYTAYRYSNCVNLTTGETLTDGLSKNSTFTLGVESKVGINSYQDRTTKLFFSTTTPTEYDVNEVEALGEYTLGDNVQIPRLDDAEKQINENTDSIKVNSIKNIVTTKNLLDNAEYTAGHRWTIANGKVVKEENSSYNCYKLTLSKGTYGLTGEGHVYNIDNNSFIGQNITSFEITEDGEFTIGINSWGDNVKKLYSAEYTADAVEALNTYTLGENVNIPRLDIAEEQISENADEISDGSIKNIVTTKNLLTNAEYTAGHRWTIANGKVVKEVHSNWGCYELILSKGVYGLTREGHVYNIDNNSSIGINVTSFEITEDGEFTIGINSWIGASGSPVVQKLHSTEYTADQVEALGEYTLGENVLTPVIDARFESVEEQISENADEISVGSIKNIVTTKNLLNFAKFVKGYKLNVDGTATASSAYDHYILILPAGSYVLHKWSDCYDLTNGIKLVDGAVDAEGTFTLDVETVIGVNSYKGNAKKLFSAKHLADQVEAIGEYTIGENVAIPQIEKHSVQNIVTTKNLLTGAEKIEGYKIKAGGVLQASATFAHWIITLPAGTYKVCNYSECYNLTTGDETPLADGYAKEAEFTLAAESKVGVNSYNSRTKKLFSSEYTADDVEDIGIYTSKGNVIPVYNDYDKYGLPVLKFTGDITEMTKDNAVTLDYVYGDLTGTCTLKWQGSSSLAYPKKNYTVKFDNAFEAADGWGEEKKYCLKANYIDFSHARNLVGAKLWGAIVESREGVENYPKLLTAPNGGAVDGFPVCVVINGKYVGLYTFNIPKDGWMFGMGEGDYEGIVCAEQPTENDGIVCKWESADVVLGRDYDIEYAPDEDNVEWMQTSLRTLIQTCIETDGTNLAALEAVLDVNSAIDYYIFSVLTNNYDGITKNHLLATYDGTKWMFGAYDMDCLFGMWWNGSKFTGNGIIGKNAHGAFKVITTYYKDELKARYQELREDILSEENLALVLTNFVGSIPKALLDEEVKIWTGLLNTSANNHSQMLDWYRRQVIKADAYIDSL